MAFSKIVGSLSGNVVRNVVINDSQEFLFGVKGSRILQCCTSFGF